MATLQTSLNEEREALKLRSDALQQAEGKVVVLEKASLEAAQQDCDCKGLQKELDGLKRHNDKLIKELERSEAQVSQQDSDCEALQKDIEGLKVHNEELKKACEKASAEAAMNDCDCETLEEELRKVREYNGKLIKELEEDVKENYESKIATENENSGIMMGQERAEMEVMQLQVKERAIVYFTPEINAGKVVDDVNYGLIYTASPEEEDDLTQIKGVGEVLKKTLNEYGVFKFRQIAAWTPQVCDDFSERLSFKGRVERDNWIGQSKSLHQAKYGESL